MDLLHSVLLVAAGIAGGIIAAIVGGAAVITFPALLAAGLPPVMVVSKVACRHTLRRPDGTGDSTICP